MVESVIASDLDFDGSMVVDQLNELQNLRTTPIGMKMFQTKAEMEAVPRIRRQDIHTTDQIVGQAARNGWTVGVTMDDLVGAQCGTVMGLHPRVKVAVRRSDGGCLVLNQEEAALLIRPQWKCLIMGNMKPWRSVRLPLID